MRNTFRQSNYRAFSFTFAARLLIVLYAIFLLPSGSVFGQSNPDNIPSDPFKDVDILAPFKGIKFSRPSQMPNCIGVGLLGFDVYNSSFKSKELPKTMPAGKIVRGGSWSITPYKYNTYIDSKEKAKFNWKSRDISFKVIEYSSPADAEKALSLLFSKQYRKAIEQKHKKLKQAHEKDLKLGTKTRESGLPPGQSSDDIAMYGDGYVHMSYNPDCLQTTLINYEWAVKTLGIVTAGKKKTPYDRYPNTEVKTRTLLGSWLSYKEKTGFARRGRFLLAARVSQSSNWPWKPNSMPKSPAYPDGLWQTVVSMLSNAHEGKKLDCPTGNNNNKKSDEPAEQIDKPKPGILYYKDKDCKQ
jgi:hypothetical protein